MTWSLLIIGLNINLMLPTDWCESLATEWRAKQEVSFCVPTEEPDVKKDI